MIINQFLDTNGDGTGTTNANGDYSVTPGAFYIQAPATKSISIQRMIVSVEDTTGMQAQEYGNLAAALSVGVTLSIKSGATTILDLTPDPVQTNADWARYCYDANVLSWGAGNELLCVRWTFSKSGESITLAGNTTLEVTLNDDLTGLLSHNFLVQGRQILPAT